MTEAIRVRPALPDDAEAAAAMVAALAAEEGMEPPALDPARFRRDGFGRRRRFEALVAELDGAPCGLAILTRGYDSQTAKAGVVLEDLYVAPQARRRGAGHALVAAAADLARRSGGAWVCWHVRPRNVRAQLFYRSLGIEAENVDLMGLAGEAFDRLADRAAG